MKTPREENILEAYAFYGILDGIHNKIMEQELSPINLTITMMNIAAYSIPYAVNGALACEIALKSALDLNICRKHLHHIDRLFNEIDDKYKEVIKRKFLEKGLVESDFQNVLKESSDLSVDWRYYYEQENVAIPKHFYDLVEAICKGMFSFSSLIVRDDS